MPLTIQIVDDAGPKAARSFDDDAKARLYDAFRQDANNRVNGTATEQDIVDAIIATLTNGGQQRVADFDRKRRDEQPLPPPIISQAADVQPLVKP